ncbi:hypothetical protein UY3_12528 [Chelonia mydas]|uniref:Myb/SANT-like DNA-binding domain-containing protein n=1 Tax=Chelonia mydas TaxID=8469 RepID=M7B025_CHEMY|nr:hypothetical protein UY3_12528 [Chelonia mydas]
MLALSFACRKPVIVAQSPDLPPLEQLCPAGVGLSCPEVGKDLGQRADVVEKYTKAVPASKHIDQTSAFLALPTATITDNAARRSSVARSSAEVTMQSSSAQVTMQSQNRKRTPAWTEWEGKKDRGYNRDPHQCRMKLKELTQAYQKSKEANSCSGSDPQTCHFYEELHAILGGAPTTTPPQYMDSYKGGVSCNRDEDFGDKEDEEEEKDGTILPDIQELFITLEPIPSQPSQGGLPNLEGGEGASGDCTIVNIIHGLKASVFNDQFALKTWDAFTASTATGKVC